MTNKTRPAFLAKRPLQENGAELIAAFALLSREEKNAVDQWLLVNEVYGSLTWQEACLFTWIEQNDF